jgi:hypothetical protein
VRFEGHTLEALPFPYRSRPAAKALVNVTLRDDITGNIPRVRDLRFHRHHMTELYDRFGDLRRLETIAE